ncbi:MAG: hypothetical protein LHV69_04525, partial [Elusimicrobia bacterium]|nr:hypothetical protein [Candidatus Obscuribacterium magneticum]
MRTFAEMEREFRLTFHLSYKKCLALLVAAVMLYETLAIPLAQASQYDTFWSQRRESLEKQKKENNSPAALAALPSHLQPGAINAGNLLNHIPQVKSNLDFKTHNTAIRRKALTPPMQSLLFTVPAAYASVKEIHESKNSLVSPILLIQDVHLNAEAQFNISHVLQALIDGKKAGVVGVEGAMGPFDFSRFRSLPDKKILRRVAEAFVQNNLMGAPSLVGITSPSQPPAFVGVDDALHYEANVKAFTSTLGLSPTALKKIDQARRSLAEEKALVFSPELKRLDALREGFHKKSVGFGVYVKKLSQMRNSVIPIRSVIPAKAGIQSGVHGLAPGFRRDDDPRRDDDLSADEDLTLQQFLAAYEMESKLDFDRVDRERRKVVEELARVLADEEVSTLLSYSLAYKGGQLSFGDYYQYLKELCQQKGVSLSKTPAFDEYIRYVLLADGINADELLKSVDQLEREVLRGLVRSSEERRIAELDDYLRLAEKLVKFELTPTEWERYGKLYVRAKAVTPAKAGIQAVNTGLDPGFRRGDDLRRDDGLSAYEEFYREADIRSRKIMENLLGATPGTERPGVDSAYVLVTGGFHTPHLTQLLREKKVSYLVLSPKVTKITDESGSAYLTVFAREKTPLDRLFAGEKLFVNPSMTTVGATKTPASRAMTVALLALVAAAIVAAGGVLASYLGITVFPDLSHAHFFRVGMIYDALPVDLFVLVGASALAGTHAKWDVFLPEVGAVSLEHPYSRLQRWLRFIPSPGRLLKNLRSMVATAAAWIAGLLVKPAQIEPIPDLGESKRLLEQRGIHLAASFYSQTRPRLIPITLGSRVGLLMKMGVTNGDFDVLRYENGKRKTVYVVENRPLLYILKSYLLARTPRHQRKAFEALKWLEQVNQGEFQRLTASLFGGGQNALKATYDAFKPLGFLPDLFDRVSVACVGLLGAFAARIRAVRSWIGRLVAQTANFSGRFFSYKVTHWALTIISLAMAVWAYKSLAASLGFAHAVVLSDPSTPLGWAAAYIPLVNFTPSFLLNVPINLAIGVGIYIYFVYPVITWFTSRLAKKETIALENGRTLEFHPTLGWRILPAKGAVVPGLLLTRASIIKRIMALYGYSEEELQRELIQRGFLRDGEALFSNRISYGDWLRISRALKAQDLYARSVSQGGILHALTKALEQKMARNPLYWLPYMAFHLFEILYDFAIFAFSVPLSMAFGFRESRLLRQEDKETLRKELGTLKDQLADAKKLKPDVARPLAERFQALQQILESGVASDDVLKGALFQAKSRRGVRGFVWNLSQILLGLFFGMTFFLSLRAGVRLLWRRTPLAIRGSIGTGLIHGATVLGAGAYMSWLGPVMTVGVIAVMAVIVIRLLIQKGSSERAPPEKGAAWSPLKKLLIVSLVILLFLCLSYSLSFAADPVGLASGFLNRPFLDSSFTSRSLLLVFSAFAGFTLPSQVGIHAKDKAGAKRAGLLSSVTTVLVVFFLMVYAPLIAEESVFQHFFSISNFASGYMLGFLLTLSKHRKAHRAELIDQDVLKRSDSLKDVVSKITGVPAAEVSVTMTYEQWVRIGEAAMKGYREGRITQEELAQLAHFLRAGLEAGIFRHISLPALEKDKFSPVSLKARLQDIAGSLETLAGSARGFHPDQFRGYLEVLKEIRRLSFWRSLGRIFFSNGVVVGVDGSGKAIRQTLLRAALASGHGMVWLGPEIEAVLGAGVGMDQAVSHYTGLET